MKNIEVYTDGSATTADKPGGYGWVVVIDGKKDSEGSGYMDLATNNDAELEAALQGLKAVKAYVDEFQAAIQINAVLTDKPLFTVTLVSDSEIILGWTNGKYRFKQENKLDKFRQLQLLVNLMRVQTRWVQGHTGDEHNERCDKLANAARLRANIDEKSLKEERKSAKIKATRTYENDLDRLKKRWQLCIEYPYCANDGCVNCKFELE